MITNTVQTLRFKGWQIVGLMLGPRAAGNGVFFVGATLFIIPLEDSLGLQRSVSSLLFAMGSMIGSLSAAVSGALMDRYGPRLVLLGSIIISALGFVLFAMAVNVAMVFIVILGLISPVIFNVAFNASSAFVNNWFDRYKATAMSFLQIGSSIGSVVIIPTLAFTIEHWQWRAGALAAAGFIVVLGLPAAVLSRNTPEELGMLPDGEVFDDTKPNLTVSEPSAQEAFRKPEFWFLVAAVIGIGGSQAATQIHFVPMMVWKGLDEVRGALILTVMLAVSTPAILVIGPLADRFGRLTVAAATSLFISVGILLLNLGKPEWSIWTAALMIAPQFAMYPLLWAALGQTFGRRAYSTIRGTVMAFQGFSTLTMPILAGFLFDKTDSYHIVLWIVMGLWLLAAAALFLNPNKSYIRVQRSPQT